MSTNFFSIFLFSLLFLFLVCKIAKKIGLVDKPNNRKFHRGQIPPVGGIAIYAGVFFNIIYTEHFIPNTILYLICSGVLVITGIFDDRFDISVVIRIFIQALVALAMMLFSRNHYINSLGHVLGSHEIVLGSFGYVVTLFAVWAVINSFNMVDGIDGLLGGLSCISFGAMGILLILDNNLGLARWCFTMISTILAYILFNLGVFGRKYKIFMGDSGSTMIGFTIIWLLLQSTQGWKHSINPVTALWIIAVPLMDMITIVYHRIRKGANPFTPDREHIHHLIIRAGFTPCQTSVVITIAAAILASFGLAGEKWLHWPESIMLLLWFGMFLMYSHLMRWTRKTKNLM